MQPATLSMTAADVDRVWVILNRILPFIFLQPRGMRCVPFKFPFICIRAVSLDLGRLPRRLRWCPCWMVL